MMRRPVLIVDDEAGIRAALREYLEALGHEVLEASNGLEALWQVKRHRPEVVLLDLSMPRLDGLGTIKHIRKFDPTIRIAVVTGLVDDATAAAVGQLGSPVLQKPVELSTIGALVGSAPEGGHR